MKTFALTNRSESTFCKISQDNGSTWIQGIIVYFSEPNNTLSIFLSSKNFHKYFNNTNKLIIKALDNKNENIYIGTVDKSKLNVKPRFIKVNIQQTLSFYDNRSYVRFLVNYNATIIDEHSNRFRTKLSDLSFNGLSFFSTKKLRNNSKISITINPAYNIKINLLGKIVNKEFVNNEFRYSVSTKCVTSDDQDNLTQVMNELLLEQNGIRKKYKACFSFKRILLYSLCLLAILGTIVYTVAHVATDFTSLK